MNLNNDKIVLNYLWIAYWTSIFRIEQNTFKNIHEIAHNLFKNPFNGADDIYDYVSCWAGPDDNQVFLCFIFLLDLRKLLYQTVNLDLV